MNSWGGGGGSTSYSFMMIGTKMWIVVFQVVELYRTVQSLFDEEEALLNLHMNVIQVVFYVIEGP